MAKPPIQATPGEDSVSLPHTANRYHEYRCKSGLDVEIVLIIYNFDMIDKIISKIRIKFHWKREKDYFVKFVCKINGE